MHPFAITLLCIYAAFSAGYAINVYEETKEDQSTPDSPFKLALTAFLFWPLIEILLMGAKFAGRERY